MIPFYHKVFTKYGVNSFLWFGPWPRLNIVDPELINEILRKPDVFQKPLTDSVIGKILTGRILFLAGEKWATHRKIISPFHMEKLKNMVPAISLSGLNMIDRWEAIVCSTNESSK